MESESSVKSTTIERVLAVAGPVLCIAISYLDPGKWATAVDGGARLGCDLIFIVLITNLVAILCQYLSALVAIATGKNIAEICVEEYDDGMCLVLGIQAEISIVVLDLTLVLGSAYSLHAVFEIDLLSCVLFTCFDAVLFPFITSFLGNSKAKVLSLLLCCFLLLSYICGILTSQTESSLSMGGMLNKLNGENVYTLMGILGANIMPHNIFLHSSLVQQDLRQTNFFKAAFFQDHLFATLCVFSGIFLVNSTLINLSANMFYNSGVVSLTLQDALSLLDQVAMSSTASFALVLLMFFSNQLVALSWPCLGRQAISRNFFKLEIPNWLHRTAIRIVAIVPALYCVWSSGAEGIFQLLIFSQVVAALLLPSSVIPLFQIASSRPIMGARTISHLTQFLAMVSFVGMLALNVIFYIEVIFGSSEWVNNLKWNSGSYVPISYPILLVTAIISLCFTLWLATTPLKSSSSGLAAQALMWEKEAVVREHSATREQTEITEVEYQLGNSVENQEPQLLQKIFGSHQRNSVTGPDMTLPETLSDSETNFRFTTHQEHNCEKTSLKPIIVTDAEATSDISEAPLPESGKVIATETSDSSNLTAEPKYVPEKTLKIEENVEDKKDKGVDSCEREESTKVHLESGQSVPCDDPESFRSLSGKMDHDVGNATTTSLSRLAGLGRATRRQLTAILDEFWGQLFDFHGQVTPEAKDKKLDLLLGVDSKLDSQKSPFSSVQRESTNPATYFPSACGRRSKFLRTSSLHNPSLQQTGMGSIGSFLGIQQSSTVQSSYMQLLDAYTRSSSHIIPDSGEVRYHSLHVPCSSNGHDQREPSTIHGYDMASYLGRVAKEKGYRYLKIPMDPPLSPPSIPSIKSNSKDPHGQHPLGQKPQSVSRTLKPPGFHNAPVSRNNSLRSERPVHDLVSPEDVDRSRSVPDVKKFYSLPDISLYIPHQDSSLSGKSSQWESPMGYGQSISRPIPEQMSCNASSWDSNPSLYSERSPSKDCRDSFLLQTGYSSGGGSLRSKQPYEQFVTDDKSPPKIHASTVNMEAKLLQSFRSCVSKILRLEGSVWLFRKNDGADEELIDRVAARERLLFEAESTVDNKRISAMSIEERDPSKLLSVPNCGDGCVWRINLIVSFGVWCIHRILELSLVENRPELWGKYTYVLNRLQGVTNMAFSKPRTPMVPCFCLELPDEYQQKSIPSISDCGLPGKFTTSSMLLDIIKDVETAISSRKGRSGTTAGNVAFPKGKENLSSVLKRYKRHLSNKPVEVGHGQSKVA